MTWRRLVTTGMATGIQEEDMDKFEERYREISSSDVGILKKIRGKHKKSSGRVGEERFKFYVLKDEFRDDLVNYLVSHLDKIEDLMSLEIMHMINRAYYREDMRFTLAGDAFLFSENVLTNEEDREFPFSDEYLFKEYISHIPFIGYNNWIMEYLGASSLCYPYVCEVELNPDPEVKKAFLGWFKRQFPREMKLSDKALKLEMKYDKLVLSVVGRDWKYLLHDLFELPETLAKMEEKDWERAFKLYALSEIKPLEALSMFSDLLAGRKPVVLEKKISELESLKDTVPKVWRKSKKISAIRGIYEDIHMVRSEYHVTSKDFNPYGFWIPHN